MKFETGNIETSNRFSIIITLRYLHGFNSNKLKNKAS